ncbi:MAG: tRNA-dihydrouridine synthase family protein [Kiritimatiellia bacterium]|jgi:nifR3 family TIM-barrel protein|nr:tRNA-dihydrouridine synthase family protein [Kiritimatiellia bacterium]MDP6631293.1 tRNA-dihydrouridine synthase family protein [Kiritimatiellia bacterium]MDP6809624.1 tRNA-dihydrouridine synthase family protein [Kiritimatiellia bacterium]MDP7023525.1 tRNA-dihydrouridine synthase family protein [Kiritimatiellia bacterium]
MSNAPLFSGEGFSIGLAPMAGFTDRAMRTLSLEQGACLAMTEVVNAAGLTHDSKRTFHLLETAKDEHPVAAHMYGIEPAVMAEAARRAEALGRFDFIDINSGCPVRKIVAKGAGAALMGDVPRLAAIVRAIREAVSLPVTVKTRIGLTPETCNIRELAAAVEDAGASCLFIHGRFACNKHSGPVDWELIGSIKQERSMPIWGNGSARTGVEAVQLQKTYGVDGVLIGRGAIGNPWIFREARAAWEGRESAPRSLDEMRATVEAHLRDLVGLKSLERKYRRAGALAAETAAVMVLRPHLLKYVGGLPGWREVRRQLNDMRTIDDVLLAVDSVISNVKSGAGRD